MKTLPLATQHQPGSYYHRFAIIARSSHATLFALTCLIFSFLNALASDVTLQSAEDLLTIERPIVIGHRGYCQIAPENTLPSFQLAKEAGADLVELDYHHTKDGDLIVIHDDNLDRTTDAITKWGGKNIRVETRTLAELRTLDAGRWFDEKNHHKPAPTYTGIHLPTLSEALDLIQDGKMTLIERKEGDAVSCIRLLREKNLVNRVVVQSYDWNFLKDFHQQEPAQVLGALGPPGSRKGKKLSDNEKVLDPSWVDEIRDAGARVVVWNNQVTEQAVTYAHKLGLKVWIYTIDDSDTANKLLDLAVDGIITNNTSRMWRTLALRPKS